ncbi:MAG: gluconate 2-dehydrogenase subunit 3 family protein [Terracidiphilus sp.]
MQRRDFLRALVSLFVAAKTAGAQQRLNDPTLPPPAPVPWTLGLNSRTPMPVTELADEVAAADLSFFTPLQMRTLTRLCDVLLPPLNGKPGAVEAQTPTFLDFLIGSSPQTQQKVYAGGLDWLEETAQAKYKTAFAQLDDNQTGELIQPWLRTWMSDHPPTEPHANFINIAHDDIRSATVNSKAWDEVPSVGAEPKTEEDIYWLPIEPDVYGENPAYAHTPPHVLAMPKAGQKIPVYPR